MDDKGFTKYAASIKQWPPPYSQKVNMRKVQFQLIKKWIATEVETLLGIEDDIVIEMIYNHLEAGDSVSSRPL